MRIPHPLGVAGLVLDTGAAFGLLMFAGNPVYLTRVRIFRLSLGAMLVGFILQLADLLIS